MRWPWHGPGWCACCVVGLLDAGFGIGSRATYDFGGSTDAFSGVALQGTQIIAAGQTVTVAGIDDLVARFVTGVIFANEFE